MELTLKADVVEDVRVDPWFINFGDVLTGTKATATLTLEVLDPKKVAIESVTCDDERFAPRKVKTKDGAKTVWEIAFAGSDQKGFIDAAVVVRTRGTDYPPFQVPMRASVVGDLRYPYQVSFYKRKGVYYEQTFQLESREKSGPFKVTDITDPDDVLRFEVKRESPTKTVVTASLKDPKQRLKESLRGAMRIRTTSRRDPLVELKYVVRVFKRRKRR